MNINTSFANRTNATNLDEELEYLLRVKTISELINNAFIFVCAPFILAGNIMVIISVVKFKKLQTAMNMIVTSLAVADCLVGFPTIPIYIVFFMNTEIYFWKYACLVKYTFVLISLPASCLNLLIVTIDRLIAVTYPLQYVIMMTLSRARIMISIVWIYVLGSAAMPLAGINTWTEKTGCDFWIILPKTYTMFVVSGVISLCIPSMIIMYIKIFNVALESRKRLQKYRIQITQIDARQRKELRKAKLMAFVFMLFGIFWFPFFTASLLKHLDLHPIVAEIVKQCALSLAMSNSLVNPILYCWIRPEFRKAYKILLGFPQIEVPVKACILATTSSKSVSGASTSSSAAEENALDSVTIRRTSNISESSYL